MVKRLTETCFVFFVILRQTTLRINLHMGTLRCELYTF